MPQKNFSKEIFIAAGCLCLTPYVSSPIALLLGISLALTLGNPFLQKTQRLTSTLLAVAIVGLGCSIDLHLVLRAGLGGLGYTLVGIGLTFLVGWGLGKFLKVERDASLLITTGTAICGGSAIAAVASAIKPKSEEVTVALATIFCLNAVGLLVFPFLGHSFQLDQTQFGLWSALAIHDTSSVVGATLQYGESAYEVGTTVKLARALWIVPLTFLIAGFRSQEVQSGKIKKPWFILGFILAACAVTYFPVLQGLGKKIAFFGGRLMVLTLFLIGSNLNRATLQAVGFRPLLMGITLWILVASTVLGSILMGWIS